MLPVVSEKSSARYIAHSTVMLEALGDAGEVLARASGFVIDEDDFLSLYTCWHVVVGADPHRLPATPPPRRHRLRVNTLAKENRQPGVTLIGGLLSFEVELFNTTGQPLWVQSGNDDNECPAPLSPPNWDCVRINIDEHRLKIPSALSPKDDLKMLLDISEDAFIVGFPYGYSANGLSPDPIFLRRTRASVWGPRFFSLLDGPGAKGMSGGPIVVRYAEEWRLAGIYNGVIFPEARYHGEELDKFGGRSALPLGKYTESSIMRSVLGVDVYGHGEPEN